ncbi:MAG: 4-alpha-glucanotransferase [Oscillospiraceae bacterium]|nr:4-alpha-glucanotransferase [Oscillospiraceae bacterium]
MNRSSGVLMPLSSLPSPHGIGTMGKAAYDFVDFLKAAGQRYWQLLPLVPAGAGDSPYSSFSTFAGNPYYIDLDRLVKDKLLRPKDLVGINWGRNPEQVDYEALRLQRPVVLRRAFERGRDPLAAEVEAFRQENSWVDNYGLYMALKTHFKMLPWMDWPEEDIRMHRPDAVRRWTILLHEEIEYHIFVQYLFFRQWNALREYAHKKGVEFIGDIPIYVALDSADVWSEAYFFQLDEKNVPKAVAGVPPDPFTADGQLWGNPLYNWDAMERDGYGWWIRRIEGAEKLYDVIRIDHFRGFASYWSVPYGELTARNGVWMPGPGMKLIGVLTSWFHELDFIAEDLGYVTEDVRKLVWDSCMPGMKILEFAFDAHGDSDYLPHCIPYNATCYLGTHDNNTVMGWLKDIGKRDRDFAARYMHITEDEGWCWGMIRTGMATCADLFVVQMQDLLELDEKARMNTPGTPSGNWRWRMLPGKADKELAKKLYLYTRTYRRV